MKFNNNGKLNNVILDDDIVITGDNNLGGSLSNILNSHDKDIKNLKSNVKWLYKYGGVGSGGGSGQGPGQVSWGILVTVNKTTAVSNNSTVYLDKNSKTTEISISISKGISNYTLEGTCYQFEGEETVNDLNLQPLNSDNSWKTKISLNLKKDGTSGGSFIVVVTDQLTNERKTISFNFISNPYNFILTKKVKYNNIEEPSLIGNTLLINNRIEKVYLDLSYTTALPLQKITYNWTIDNSNFGSGEIVDQTEIVSNIITLDISEISNLDNTGLHKIVCNIQLIKPNVLDPIEMTLQESITFLPEDLYLVINSTEPLYDEHILEQPTEFGNLNKALKIKVIPYLGNDSGDEVSVYARLYNYIEDTNIWEKYGNDTGITKVKLKQESPDLPGIIFRDNDSEPGWKKIEIIGTIGSQKYQKDYYIYLDSPLSRFNWFHTNENIVSKEINSTYFRKGTLGMDNYEPGSSSGLDNNSDFYKFFSTLDDNNSKVITKESNTSTINLKKDFKEGNNDLCISIGICYSENNTIENPILMAETDGNNSGTIYVIELYQNKIILKKKQGSYSSIISELSIYLEKTPVDNYSGATTEDYHLVQVMLADDYEKKEGSNNTSTFYKKLYVYIDGVIEGSATEWFDFDVRNLDKIHTCSGNYKINLLEITQFPKVTDSTNNSTYYIDNTDLFTYYYYLSYKYYNSDNIDDNLSNLINNIYETGSFIIENELLKLSSDTIMKNLIASAGIPSLYCEISNSISFDNKEYTSTTWLNSKYGENTSDTGSAATKLEEVRVPINKLYWCDSKNNTELTEITTKNLWNTDNPHFYLRLQGSSTMRYKSKNFTLGVESGDGYTYLFSPNYKKTDKTSFLPEQSFTLKADVVDSSHTNNCCLGKFINNVTEAESEAKITNKQSTVGIYSDHIKPCLTGFPILMFLGIKSTEGEVTSTSYYYLGIYNFNLGRESHFNLGYIKDIDTILGNIEKEGFVGVVTDNDNLNLKEKLIVAEIQGNGEVFDFHQYDSTILFPLNDQDKNCMFGDFVKGSNQVSTYTDAISSFVQSVSKAGGYLFKKIGKNFNNINDSSGNLIYNNSYHTENTVPDYRNQVIRKIENNRDVYTSKKNKDSESDITDLKKCINGYTDTINGSSNFIPAKLNYRSLVDYYTICMAFGLVDSVQKNLNIKTWKDTFGIYFYDMDTSFGINNAGLPTSIFCFSDYWRSNNSTIQEPDPFDYSNPNPSNKQIEVPTSLTLYRDYFPTNESEEGYDIPSSYLFAIAKYAKIAESDEEGGISVDNYFPQQLWADWRSDEDILKTPQNFFNTYYKGHLGNIPGILKSLNYRSKYLFRGYHTAESTKDFDSEGKLIEFNSMAFTTDLSSFNGSRLSYVKNWIINRVHILDLYFNILKNNITFDNVTSEEVISEPQHNISIDDLNDVIIQKDIFSNINNPTEERKYKAGNITFYVEVPNEFCPLAIKIGNSISYYILRKTNTIYKISQNISGNVNVRFGGSTQFSKLDSISSFLTKLSESVFYLKSNKLNHIISKNNSVNDTGGTSVKSMILDIPAAESIVLTDSTYDFILTINDKYQYLSELDISNSKISIDTSGNNAVAPSLRKINLSNINSSKINLLKIAEDQINVTLTNSSIAELNTYCWKTESTSQSNLFSLSNKTDKLINVSVLELTTNKYRDLEINSINDLRTAALTGFKSIKILDCSNLDTLNITPPSDDWSLELNNCSSIKSISLVCDNLTKLDLRNCYNLNSLKLTGSTDKLTELDLSNTKIKAIELNSENTSYNGLSLLDLTKFPNLSKFYIEENKEITYVKFKNDGEKYFELKDKAFFNCNNLIRVFGNILLTGSYIFSGCSKFSVHGYFENSDGTLRLVNGGDKIKFNDKPICNDAGQVIHPLETLGLSDYNWLVVNDANWGDSKTRYNMITQSGDYVTNIRVNNLYSNIGYTGTFSNTSVTIFDIYYILQNIIPKDEYRVDGTGIVNYETPKGTDFLTETGESIVDLGEYLSGTNNGWGAYTFYSNTSFKSGDCRLFNWTTDYDNSPNKYILHDWGWTLGSARRFIQNRLGIVKFFIPTENTPGIMDQLRNCNDFEVAFYSSSANSCIYTDKTVLHCTCTDVKLLSNPEKLSEIFYNICFIDPLSEDKNVNNWEYSDIFDSNGKLKNTVTEIEIEKSSGDKLFKYLGNITGILDSFEFQSSYRLTRFLVITKFINFTKCKLLTENSKNKNKGTYFTGILASLRTTYGCGTFKLENLLDEEYLDKLIVINNSIRVGDYYDDIIPKMELNNDTFKHLSSENFLQFGYYVDGNTTGDNGNISQCSFNGFRKLIGNNFTNIISNLKNLTHCTGLFANGEYNSEIELPGKIFENNTKLRKLNYCFYNLKANITLTSNGFSNCTELNNVRYLFATKRDVNYLKKDGDIKLGIHSKIPYKFLYHGNQINDGDSNFYITYKGLDNSLILSNVWEAGDNYYEYQPDNSIKYRISKEDVQDNSILPTNELAVIEILQNNKEKQENVYPGNLDPSILETLFDNYDEIRETTISFTKPRSNIINMERCFHNQMFLLNYSQDSNVSKENNGEYIPYKFYKKDNIWVERDNNPIHTNEKIDIWYNDGSKLLEEEGRNILDPSYSITTNGSNYTLDGDQIIYPDETGTGRVDCIENYSCPPDLFRYCNNTDSLNITGVFENCGYDRTNRTNNGTGDFNSTNYGIPGRICPYLLKPISNVTDISRLFLNNKRLSHYCYKTKSETASVKKILYMIPEDFFKYATNITTLDSTFYGMIWKEGIKLDNIFTHLTRPLRLNKTFYAPYFPTENAKSFVEIKNIFINNTITSAKEAFHSGFTGDITRVTIADQIFDINPRVKFIRNFNKSKLNNLFSEYSKNYYNYVTNHNDLSIEDMIGNCFDGKVSIEFNNSNDVLDTITNGTATSNYYFRDRRTD